MYLPSVSIVIPVYNGEDNIDKCIESIINQDYPKEKTEIIIVDNNSKDNTANIIKTFPVKYIFEKKQGVCFARNKGLELANNELIAYTDSDCIAEKNWISRLVPHFSDETIGGVGGHLEAFPPENYIERYIALREVLTQEKMYAEKIYSPPFFITANVIYRANILKKIGGFDNFFKIAGEDADISWRVVAEGYKLILEPSAIVFHKHRSNLKRFCKQMFNYGIGSAAIFKKYHKKFGVNYWFDWDAYQNMLGGIYYTPYNFFTKKETFEKLVPILDATNNFCFIAGKIYGSLKYKTIVF